MPRFFTVCAPEGQTICITGEDAHHITRVLRMKLGETLTVCDGAGTDYLCTLQQVQGKQVVCQVYDTQPSCGEPDVEITLYMALPKGDKMDFIVQKATELGVSCIVPYAGARSVSRPEEKAMEKKIARWRRIAREAAQQSSRGRIPEVLDCMCFAQAVQRVAQAEMPLFFYEMERDNHVKSVLSGQSFHTAAIVIGPEGGFADEEAQCARQLGLHMVSLGPRILRCETAPLVALTTVLYESGNL